MTEAILFKDYVDVGLPEKDTFQLERVERPVAQEGQVLLELVYVSVDPYMRGRMRNQAGYFVGPFQPGKPLTGLAVARVVESKAPSLSVGAHVTGFLQWQQLQVAPAEALTPVDEQVLRDTYLPLSVYLGALGMTGITAWASLERIGKPKAGETVFVSAAAGAVGLMVGQLCKHVYGCTVIGAAGSDEKIKTLLEYGYDAAFNYKTEKAPDALKRLCPKGIDVYYDNVGGAMLEAALDVCNVHARVVACGSISQYNDAPEDRYGVKNLFLVVTRRIHMQGFIAGDFSDMKTEFFRHMSGYIREGKVKHVEHLVPGGLAQAGTAFNDMMGGANIGKTVVQCAEDPFRKQA